MKLGISKLTITLVVVTLAVSGASLLALRTNNQRMIALYKQVELADLNGQGVHEALEALQNHVATHMNSTPPKLGDNPSVQLKASYERAKKIETNRVSAEREKVAVDATAYCEATIRNTLLSNRASCVAEYIAARPVVEKPILADLYRYDFVSPRWTPDTAGWLLALTGCCLILLGVRICSFLIMRIYK